MTEAEILYYLAVDYWLRNGGPEPKYPASRVGSLRSDVDAEGVPYSWRESWPVVGTEGDHERDSE